MEYKVAKSYQHMQIKAINEETHKALVEGKCPRCGGLGFIVSRVENGRYIPIPVDGGVCYKCEGSGKESKWVKAYTEKEYAKYEATNEKKKERALKKIEEEKQEKLNKSEENKIKALAELGYDTENPQIWLIGGGSTYEIKEQLKELGCKFVPAFGWYNTHKFDVPEGYKLVSINFDDVYIWLPLVKRFELKENAKEIADAAKNTLEPESFSEYEGKEKERLRDLEVVLTGVHSFDGFYGTSYIYTFKHGENVLVWMTSSWKKIEVGEDLILTGTVKSHEEYRGVKQTKLSRCVVKSKNTL